MLSIATLLPSSADYEAVVTAASEPALITRCSDTPSLKHRIQSTAVDFVVCAIHDRHGCEPLRLASEPLGTRASGWVVVVKDLQHAAAAKLLHAAKRGARLYIAIGSHEELRNALQACTQACSTLDPQPILLARVASLARPCTAAILVAAIALGFQKCRVRSIERVCSLSRRSLERRLRADGLVGPRTILDSTLSIYLLWQLSVLNWSLKRVSAEAGFATPSSLSRFLRAKFNRTVPELRCTNFEQAVEVYLRDLNVAPVTSNLRARSGTAVFEAATSEDRWSRVDELSALRSDGVSQSLVKPTGDRGRKEASLR